MTASTPSPSIRFSFSRSLSGAAFFVLLAACGGSDRVPTASPTITAPETGNLSIVVTGLPGDARAALSVTGPAGYFRPLTASETLTRLSEGSYEITAAEAHAAGDRYRPDHHVTRLNVTRGLTASVPVAYSIASGSLAVTLAGLPKGVSATIALTGPGGFSGTFTRDTVVRGLTPGTYSITAAPVTIGSDEYRAGETMPLHVPASPAAVPVAITYLARPVVAAGYNLMIDGFHIQQVVQRYDGTVPLVTGREGLLRVFLRATDSNSARPSVRVRLYHGASLVATSTIDAPRPSVPTTIDQATLGSSWNMVIPAAQMMPGLRILADVDPSDAVPETSETDNAFPVTGTAEALDVRTMPAFEVRLVPVRQAANGLTGGVTAANAGDWLAAARKLFPLGKVNVDVREPFTTTAPALQPNDANRAWTQVLSELNALRAAEGGGRFYAGVARVAYSSGIAGLGYVPGRTTLSWDHSASAPDVIAHELGHNFGRLHAPCGGAGGPDPAYPYSGGQIGVYGYDFAAAALRAPTTSDLMGYCGANWISDYTYTAVMNYRISSPFVSTSRFHASAAPRPGLLIWGRIENGVPILEPAFEITAPAFLPARAGPHRLQAYGPLGEALLDLAFEGERVADATDSTLRHFAFVIPLDVMRGMRPAELRLSAHGRRAGRRAASLGLSASRATARRNEAGSIRVDWSDETVQGIMVRNVHTGAILSFARSPEAVVAGVSADLELTASDGVRSTTTRLRVEDARQR